MQSSFVEGDIFCKHVVDQTMILQKPWVEGGLEGLSSNCPHTGDEWGGENSSFLQTHVNRALPKDSTKITKRYHLCFAYVRLAHACAANGRTPASKRRGSAKSTTLLLTAFN